MNKAIITTLIGGAVVAGGIMYSKSQEGEASSIITLQGTNSLGIDQTLMFDNRHCSYSDSTGISFEGSITSSDIEQSCMLGIETNLSETQFVCAYELCKNTP